MKKFSNRRLISALCALALIVACGIGFAVPAGAWGFGDLTGEEFFLGEGTEPLKQNYFRSVDGYSSTTYAYNEWPTEFNFGFDGSYSNFTLFEVDFDANVMLAGHGLCVYGTVPKNIEGLTLTMLRIYVDTDDFVAWCFGELDISTGETRGWQSLGRIFNDDFACFVLGEASEFYNICISGTLFRSVARFSLVAYFDEVDGKQFTLNYFQNDEGASPIGAFYTTESVVPAVVESVSVNPSNPAPYYPGTTVQMQADVAGTGNYDSSVTWSVESGISGGVTIDENGLLYIPTDEQALSVEVTATSIQDPSISGSYVVDITYPLSGVSIIPSGEEFLPQSGKDRTLQYSLLLPNGDPYEYEWIEWVLEPTSGHDDYFEVDDTGLVTIKAGAPVGSGYTLRWAYLSDPDTLSPASVSMRIISNEESIRDELDGYINGNHGFDPGGSDFSGAADDLHNSQIQMGDAMSGGMNALGGMMGSPQMLGTLTTLGSAFDAVFEGHEITICGVTANPFTLLVFILAIAVLIPLALKYVFRKRGGDSGG